MRWSGCTAALPSWWRRCRYQSRLRAGRSGTASSISSTLGGIGRPTDATLGRRGLRGATSVASLLCSTRRRLPRLLMQFAPRSSRSTSPDRDGDQISTLSPAACARRRETPASSRAAEYSSGSSDGYWGCSWHRRGASTVPESKMNSGRKARPLSIRDEAWNISARSPLEEIQAAPFAQLPCAVLHSTACHRTANVVRPCAHINIPTAITPTVTSAIQVRSLLFSANQSAIDEHAVLLSLALCADIVGLLQLKGHRTWLQPPRGKASCSMSRSAPFISQRSR